MGHGVRAALVTAMLRALIETHAGEAADPGRFLTELNSEFTQIMKQTGTLVFATMLYCVINITKGEAQFGRAGHPAPLHARRNANEVQAITGQSSAGPALGIFPNAHFKTTETMFVPGDFFLLFTDGIIEVDAAEGREFGVDGLLQSVRSSLNQPCDSVLDGVIQDVYAFADSTALTDDVCLVAVEL
jgi:serine phosphatase RsbU (regulator of sigma subunit)